MALYVLFFISGISGLIYQVSWVRTFGNIFGNTVYSATLVTAVFMAGLGVGSFLTGILVDRRAHKALELYGWYELGIALLGLSLAWWLPDLEALSASISTYVQDDRGWYHLSLGSHLLRYLIAAVVLLPSTVLMGGTLTLLIRHTLSGDLSSSGWKVGLLYGVNTIGAALGSLGTDFVLVPSLGVLGCQTIAIAGNFIAGLGAFRLARASAPPPVQEVPPETPAAHGGGLVTAVGLALLVSGAVGMGLEITWFRFLSSVLGATRPVFSTMLAVILVGIWIGSLAGGFVHRRFGRPIPFLIAGQAALAVTAAFFLAAFDRRLLLQFSDRRVAQVVVAIAVAGIPSVLMGIAYPLANAAIQRSTGEIGRRAGLLYLFNTLGAVLGAMLTGFLLLPMLGMQRSVLSFLIASIATVLLLDRVHERDRSLGLRWRGSWASIAALGIAALVYSVLPNDHLLTRIFPLESREDVRTIALSESISGTIKIQDYAGIHRTLHTDGHPMSGNRWDSQRYMRAFVHVPLLHLDQPKAVLVICFGVGTTLHAASTHPTVERLEIADLSQDILEHASFFTSSNRGVLDDPRVSVFVNDGRQHLRMTDREYDLITLEPPPIDHAGVTSLYSEEFYRLARAKLRSGGFLSQWLPAYQVPGEVTDAMVRAFIDVFPDSILLSGYHNELILMGRKDQPIRIDPESLEARLERAPTVREDLERVHLATLTELIGTFAGASERLVESTVDSPPVTDDFPILEYSTVAYAMSPIPADLFDVSGARSWCPTCFDENGRPIPKLANLDVYLSILGTFYASDQFLAMGVPQTQPPRPLMFPDDPRVDETIQSEPFLKAFLAKPPQ